MQTEPTGGGVKIGYLATDSGDNEHIGIVTVTSDEELLARFDAAGWTPKLLIEIEQSLFGYASDKQLPEAFRNRIASFVAAAKSKGLRRGAYAGEQFEQAVRSSFCPTYLEKDGERKLAWAAEQRSEQLRKAESGEDVWRDRRDPNDPSLLEDQRMVAAALERQLAAARGGSDVQIRHHPGVSLAALGAIANIQREQIRQALEDISQQLE